MTYSANSSNEELMIAFAREDDVKAFEALYRRLSPKVYGYLRLRLQNREDVDEVFQKVFAKLHASRESFDPKYPVLQWVFVMARSALLDHLKSSNRKEKLKEEVKIFEGLTQTDTQVSLSEQMDGNLLQTLNADAQAIVKLRVIDELDFSEISKITGKSEASIRQVLSRSLRKLRLGFGGTK